MQIHMNFPVCYSFKKTAMPLYFLYLTLRNSAYSAVQDFELDLTG